MGDRISQIDLVSGIAKLLDRLGLKNAEPRILNKIIAAADMIVAECERDPVMAADNMGLGAWLASDDTGASSLWMAHVLYNVPSSRGGGDGAYPHDPSDFGRCYRFLRAVPDARRFLGRMAESGPVWAEYVKRWNEMERLYEEERPNGHCPMLYEMMRGIQDRVRKQEPPNAP